MSGKQPVYMKTINSDTFRHKYVMIFFMATKKVCGFFQQYIYLYIIHFCMCNLFKCTNVSLSLFQFLTLIIFLPLWRKNS